MRKPTRFIQAMQAETGWKLSGQSLIGQKDGYWFTITQPGLFQPIIVKTAVTGPDSARLQSVLQAIKARKKTYRLGRAVNEHHVLVMTLNADMRADKDRTRVSELILEVARLLAQFGIAGGCSICGSAEPLETVRIGETPAPVCSTCLGELRSEFAAIADRNEISGNYPTGIIGALLGAIIGAALWLLVSYLGFYASIVGFVMAFLAQFGYRLFKGKIGRGMPWVILAAVIAGIFVANTVEIAIGLAQDPDIGLTFGEALRVAPLAFIDSELFYVGRVWANVAVGLFFALMGSWRMIRNLSSEAKGETYQIEPI